VKLAALATLFILAFTVRPAGTSLPDGWNFALASGQEATAELLQNLILFMPLGAALVRTGMRRVRLVAAGGLLSFAIEFTQQWLPGRDPSVGDIVANTVGTAAGAALAWTVSSWLTVSARRAPWQSLAAAAVAVAAWVGTGWLLQPAFPEAAYATSWTPPSSGVDRARFRGRVLAATLGHLSLEPGPITAAGAAPARTLLAGAPLRIIARTSAGAPPRRFAPLVAIGDELRDVILVGVDRRDLVLAYRTPAWALRLDRPDLRLRGAAPEVRADRDTFTVAVWREHARWCLMWDTRSQCGLDYTVGDGWRLIFYPSHFPAWALGALNACWIGGATLLAGLWARRHAASATAFALLVGTLALGPPLLGLGRTPLGEWVGAAAGAALGVVIGARVRLRQTPPALPHVRRSWSV
jgi:hypothetical protein